MKISWISMKYQDQTYAITTIIRIQTCKINVIYGKNEHQAIKKTYSNTQIWDLNLIQILNLISSSKHKRRRQYAWLHISNIPSIHFGSYLNKHIFFLLKKNCDEQGRNQNVLLKILICEAEIHSSYPTQHITYKTQ